MTGMAGVKRRRPGASTTAASAAACVLLTTQFFTQVNASSVVQQKLYGLPTGLAYYMEVKIGTTSRSKNTFNLLLDTGSSNTAVATSSCCSATSTTLFSCAASSTCVDKAQTVSVTYVTGSWSGEVVEDTFSSSEIGSVTSMPLAEILQESSFIQSGYDGIVGLAYSSIGSPTDHVPTPYFDKMRSAKTLPDVFSTLLCGSLQELLVHDMSYSDTFYSGELLLGGSTGPNGEVYHKDDLVYTPLVQERWYNVLTTGIKVGSKQIDVDCKDINSPRTIIDSGTSNIAFTSTVYTAVVEQLRTQVQKVIPGVGDSFFSDSVPCCQSFCDPTNKNATIFDLPSLTISFALDGNKAANQQISVTIPPEYIWRPLMVSTTFGVQKCRVFGISEGDVTLLGDVFMDGLLTVHDRENKRLGLGVAKSCPNGVTSSKSITVESLSGGESSFCDCVGTSDRSSSLISAYFPFSSKPCFFWLWWMYLVVASAVLILCSIGVVAYVCCKRRKYRHEARRMRLARQQSDALNRNLLTPQCDSGTPPATGASHNAAPWLATAANPQRPSNLTSSTNSSARQSEVHIEMRHIATRP